MDSVAGFLLAGLSLTGSPGPATLSLAATGAAFVARRGLGYMAGIVAGVVAVMALVASGLVGLMLAVPGGAPVMAARPSRGSCWRSRIRKPTPWPPCSRASC